MAGTTFASLALEPPTSRYARVIEHERRSDRSQAPRCYVASKLNAVGYVNARVVDGTVELARRTTDESGEGGDAS